MRKFEAWQRDTTDYSPYPVRIFLMVAFGRDGSGVEHVMFDTDGDYDFSDETDYRLGEQPPLVRMAYERVVNKKIVPDITWVAGLLLSLFFQPLLHYVPPPLLLTLHPVILRGPAREKFKSNPLFI